MEAITGIKEYKYYQLSVYKIKGTAAQSGEDEWGGGWLDKK